ncbi:hypothetical protein ACFU96_44065 [Streptomyces sp. NPDC057620]|uniref:hypothetical protein n=1 Tax=Streptomyces sp. NPDC057620 TaxID=3346185 RepID=UPI0036BB3C4C
MTDTLRTPPTAHHRRPFARNPQLWEKKRSRALRTGHVRDDTCSAACELVLVHEHTPWGWLAWTVPADGSAPQTPHQIAVLTPHATRGQRLAPRWLSRRPARRVALAAVPGALRLSAAAIAVLSVMAGLLGMSRGVPAGIALPAMLLAPLLAEHVPDRLDTRAREHVHMVEGSGPCHHLQHLAALHTSLSQAAAECDRYELRRSAELGHGLLWDAASLLRHQDVHAAPARLAAHERLLLQLVHQAGQTLQHCTAEQGAVGKNTGGETGAPRLPDPAPSPAPHRAASAPLAKGPLLMPPPQPGPSPTQDVYLLFAHAPYYPGPGTREINTTVVAADSLLHPRVCQPDGRKIHHLLVQGRQPGEIVPLSTLTHELDGGARWPTVGDWERVTTDLVQLVRCGSCDALSLGLPEITRALLCAGPHSRVRTRDAATDRPIDYGSAARAAALADVSVLLERLVAERPFWPGDDLVSPLKVSGGSDSQP